jgi:hypothetical protein
MVEGEETISDENEGTTEVVITEGEVGAPPVVESDTTVVTPPPAVSDKAAVQIAKEQTKQEGIRADTEVKLSQIDAATRLEIEKMIEAGMTKRTQMEKEAVETAVAGEVAETAIKEDEDPETLHPWFRTWQMGRKKAQ